MAVDACCWLCHAKQQEFVRRLGTPVIAAYCEPVDEVQHVRCFWPLMHINARLQQAGTTGFAPGLCITALLWLCPALICCCALACRAALGAIPEMSNYRCAAAQPP
jgi:hypothetical protein